MSIRELHPRELWNHFAFIHDDDVAAGGLSEHFFPQKRPSAALYEIEIRIDFVGAVYGDFDFGVCLESCQGNIQPERLLFGAQRTGNAHNIF